MKRLLIILAGALSITVAHAGVESLDGIWVVVNDTVITYGQVEDKIAESARTLQKLYPNDRNTFQSQLRKLESDQLEEMIEAKLIVDDFTAGGYATNVLESAIDDVVNRDIKDNYGNNRSTLMRTLQEEGITFEAYRRTRRENFIISYMVDHTVGNRKILISPQQIETYYDDHKDNFKVGDQIKLRMIPVTQSPDSPPGTARQMADEILRKLDSGVPFAEMASVYCSDIYRANGGDRGWVSTNDWNAELATQMSSLKAGEHSKVIELPGVTTCYLLEVDAISPAHVSALSEVRAKIEQTLKTQQRKRLQDQWIQRLKEKSHIAYYNSY